MRLVKSLYYLFLVGTILTGCMSSEERARKAAVRDAERRAAKEMEDRTLINANVTWRDVGDQYWLTLYGKNLGDEEYRVGSNSVAGLWNFTLFGPPMEYGIEAGVRW